MRLRNLFIEIWLQLCYNIGTKLILDKIRLFGGCEKGYAICEQ